MNNEQIQLFRELYTQQQIAALGTLHKGHPFVSMVPFAVLPESASLIIHVSQLASHTRDMLQSPPVSVLICASPEPAIAPQALPRITVQGHATQYNQAENEYESAKEIYLKRFPHSLDMFSFTDFSLFRIVPSSVRFVGGFGQARTLAVEAFTELLRGA